MNNITDDLNNYIVNNLNNKLDSYFIEGLKRKGFEFKHQLELEMFIKYHCRCEENTDLKQRVYYVDDIPFFLHIYKIEMDLNPTTINNTTTMSASYGSYKYL